MDLENWALNKLSQLLGLDDETLKTQVLPYMMTINNASAFSNHLMEMLGDEPNSIAFIQEFTTRRFPPSTTKTIARESKLTTPTPQQQNQKEKQRPSSQPPQQQQPPQNFPALPQAILDRETEWPANINVYIKGGHEGDDMRGASRKSNKKVQQSPAEASTSTSTSSTAPATEKKKKNKKNEMSLEAALKELHIKSMEPSGKRRVCDCQATKHPLLTVAPNCLNCGKIICTAEGPGPCTFCGTPVLSKDQQVAVIEEAKRKRAEQKQQQRGGGGGGRGSNAKGPRTPAVGYAAKVSGEIIPRNAYQEPIFDQKAEEDSRRRAEEHKEKLLEFQRSSAKRTTVIDQATDFTLPTDQLNPWLTPQERALMLKKQQSNYKKLNQSTGDRRRVMTIDIQSRKVIVDEASAPLSSDESEPEVDEPPSPSPQRGIDRNKEDGSAGTYAHNPLLKGVLAPQFVGKHAQVKGGKNRRRKERLQFDEDKISDMLFGSSIVEDRDIALEPNSCVAKD